MSRDWLDLPNDLQEDLLARAWSGVIDWGIRNGVDRVRAIHMDGDKDTRDWLSRNGLARSRRVELAPPELEALLREMFPRPLHVFGYANEELLIEVYKTWDGMLVFDVGPPDLTGAPRVPPPTGAGG